MKRMVALLHVPLLGLFSSWLCARFADAQTTFNEVKFGEVVVKMESDVLDLARVVEDLFFDRCSVATLNSCTMSNYDDCRSQYPSQSCPGGASHVIPQCGDGVSCSGLFDYSVSSVRLPYQAIYDAAYSPTDSEVVETVCFTRALDDWLTSKHAKDMQYWENLGPGAQPPGMFFGSYTGVFRIYPARQSETCGTYDPRIRPWYVAASSGPKNVIMVLDTSGSMLENDRLGLMKEAARRVVDTLSVGDRVALVTFNSVASVVTDTSGSMYQATEANKAILINAINELDAEKQTNFFAGFQKAFEILENSIENEYYVNCNTAILFLTDGVMTEPENMTEEQVMDFIVEGIHGIQNKTEHKVLLFTYSIAGSSNVDTFPKQLACSTELGVWTSIQESTDIVDSLSNYYRLFSLGLSSQTDFTAWVEPYEFQTGGVVGTTVSAPVYDRSKQPPLLIGVVGIDYTLAALNAALKTDNSEESVNRVVKQSIAVCPSLNLTLCDLESYRYTGRGEGAICTSNCSQFADVIPQKCANISQELYPIDLLQNANNEGKSYTERVCCEVGTNTTSEQCPAANISANNHLSAIIGGAVGAFVCLFLVLIGIKKHRGSKAADELEDAVTASAPEFDEDSFLKMPPPTNPNAIPPAMRVIAVEC